MYFDTFFNTIHSIAEVDLPSVSSHIKMAPSERIKFIEQKTENTENARNAAVMMLFYPKNNITNLLLIVRNSYSGVSSSELNFTLQEEEVAGIIEMPLSLLLDDSIISIKTLETSYTKSIEVPVFQVDNHIVWGATAMMLSELKDALKMVL